MYKGVSQCGYVLLWSVQPLPLLSLPLYLLPPHFQKLSIHILISFTSYVLQYYWCYIILFSFPSFTKFWSSSTITKCSTSEFVYIMLVLCICLSFGFIFHVWKKTCSLCVFEPGLLHLTWCPLISSIYLQTTCHYSFYFFSFFLLLLLLLFFFFLINWGLKKGLHF
jgi:hypothetical protein